MRYNRLGNSGLVVSELCLGAMTFGNKPSRFFQHELDQDGATALVRQAIDGGINFIDTANVYTQGQSEEFVGGALRALGVPRQEIVVATKGMGPMGQGPNDAGTGAKHLLHHIDESLARLGLDHVDLYQIHGWDPHTPMEETLRALEDIVRSGRARYVGVSNWAAWQIVKALGIEERRGWDGLVSLQAYYTVASRDLERELVPMLPTTASPQFTPMPTWNSGMPAAFHSGSFCTRRLRICRAVLTAKYSWSATGTGALNSTIMQSPMNLSRVPPLANTMPHISEK